MPNDTVTIDGEEFPDPFKIDTSTPTDRECECFCAGCTPPTEGSDHGVEHCAIEETGCDRKPV